MNDKNKWGGKRENAGRPKVSNPRKQIFFSLTSSEIERLGGVDKIKKDVLDFLLAEDRDFSHLDLDFIQETLESIENDDSQIPQSICGMVNKSISLIKENNQKYLQP